MTEEDDDPEFLAFVESEAMDAAVDYSTRGRAYQRLSQDELISAWVRAFDWMADDPINPLAQEREGDLACEIKLRGGEPPMKDVTEISRRWAKATLPYLKRVFTDPEAMASLEEELEDFLSRREQDH